MNPVAWAARQGAVKSFLRNWGGLGLPPPTILENPIEEIDHELGRGKRPKLYGMGGNGGGQLVGRIEENYLYATRRFPSRTTDNTIGSGAVVAGDYTYFNTGLGDAGTTMGYFSISAMTLQQTNMASGGRIPHGKAFRLWDLGVAFNARAAAADIAQLLDICNLRFNKQMGGLVMDHGPVGLWPGGAGLYGFASAATTVAATTIDVQTAANGMPAMSNVRKFRNPRNFSANEAFTYAINIAHTATPANNTTIALTAFVEMRIWLFGQQADKITS